MERGHQDRHRLRPGHRDLRDRGRTLYQSTTRQVEDARWVSHTREVVATSPELLTSLVDAETGQRGFVITGEESYLTPYTAGVAAAETTRKRLAELVKDNVKQTSRLDAFTPMITERLTTLQDAVEARRRSDFAAAQQIILSGRGKVATDTIRQRIRDLRIEEEDLVAQRAAAASAAANEAKLTILLGTLLALLVAAVTGVILTRNIAQPLGGLTTLAERITVGDLTANFSMPVDRVDEVGALARAFQRMSTSLRTMATTAEQIAAGDSQDHLRNRNRRTMYSAPRSHA